MRPKPCAATRALLLTHDISILTGPRFKQRLEGIIEKFDELRDDLDKERKFMNRVWAKREGQIQGVIDSMTGMWGDLQGIAGKALPEISSLDMPLIEGPGDLAAL